MTQHSRKERTIHALEIVGGPLAVLAIVGLLAGWRADGQHQVEYKFTRATVSEHGVRLKELERPERLIQLAEAVEATKELKKSLEQVHTNSHAITRIETQQKHEAARTTRIESGVEKILDRLPPRNVSAPPPAVDATATASQPTSSSSDGG